MSYRQGSNTASKHERLMDELAQRLLSMSDARDSKGTVPVEPPEADRGAAGEPRSVLLPASTASLISCSCHQHENLHVQVTIKCPCSRPSTAEASTQTDLSPVEKPQAMCINEASVTAPQPVKEHEVVFHKSSVQSGASFAKGASAYRSTFSSHHAARPTTVTFAEEELSSKQELLRRQTTTPLFPADEEFSPRASAEERRRSVHETLAHVRETILEVLHDSPRAVTTGTTATSTSGIFETMFPAPPDDASLPPLAADSNTVSSSRQ
ncbi:hypothetical protein MTO96_039034, partial [Rhipicephalus appendiculatus]